MHILILISESLKKCFMRVEHVVLPIVWGQVCCGHNYDAQSTFKDP